MSLVLSGRLVDYAAPVGELVSAVTIRCIEDRVHVDLRNLPAHSYTVADHDKTALELLPEACRLLHRLQTDLRPYGCLLLIDDFVFMKSAFELDSTYVLFNPEQQPTDEWKVAWETPDRRHRSFGIDPEQATFLALVAVGMHQRGMLDR